MKRPNFVDDRSATKGLQEVFPPAFYFANATAMVVLGFWPLYAPASMTTACDDLIDAIKDLRCLATQLRSAAELARIVGLTQHASELNRGVGLCFTLSGLRIDERFVTNALRGLFVLMTAIEVLAVLTAD